MINNMIKIYMVFFSSFFSCYAAAQSTRDYKIIKDTVEHTHYVVHKTTGKKFEIDYPHSERGIHSFRHGFVYVRTSDMYGLMDLDGHHVLEPSHFIRFNIEDSIISAYVCQTKNPGWIFLDFNGDTISYGSGGSNYCPTLDQDLNPANIIENGKPLWGYLDKKARWVTPPIYEDMDSLEKSRK